MKTRISEQDEFLLSQLLDDELSAEVARELRQRMEREPTLLAAYQSMERVHGLVSRQTPAANLYSDWAGLQERVMDAVRQEPVPQRQVIRFPTWMRVALPLAAAAAIALVVTVRPGAEFDSSPRPEQITTAARNEPVAPIPAPVLEPTPAPIVVAFNRPMEKQAEPVRIQFARSAELDRQYREMDQQRQGRPTAFTYTMHADARSATNAGFLDAL